MAVLAATSLDALFGRFGGQLRYNKSRLNWAAFYFMLRLLLGGLNHTPMQLFKQRFIGHNWVACFEDIPAG